MQVVESARELRRAVAAARGGGQLIGLVPTMGALHAGHLSLVEAARRECGFTIVSIFVNPAQFGPGEDYQRYPRTLEADLSALTTLGPDLVFVPDVEDMYPAGHATFVEMQGPAEPLEGRHRPGHFRGVATVVLKLFNLATPDRAYFGQKDYQQALVVRRLVGDLDLPIEIRVCPIVREPDGLALSSRNAYLDAGQRRQALVLGRSLRLAAELVAAGERRAENILERMRAMFAAEPQVRVDYLALVDPQTLADVERVDAPTLAAVAARVGSTRLIDNQLLYPENSTETD
ncbi:MAG: pantoate--beta-alanine ligase [Pirellulales bacterium]